MFYKVICPHTCCDARLKFATLTGKNDFARRYEGKIMLAQVNAFS